MDNFIINAYFTKILKQKIMNSKISYEKTAFNIQKKAAISNSLIYTSRPFTGPDMPDSNESPKPTPYRPSRASNGLKSRHMNNKILYGNGHELERWTHAKRTHKRTISIAMNIEKLHTGAALRM